MRLKVEDNNAISFGVHDEGVRLRTNEVMVSGSDNYEDLENKPQIEGVTLVGDVSLEDLGIVIPEKVSELENDEGFITEEDIPPIATDLGYIDPEPYEYDPTLYMNTLTKNGFYYFTFGGDDLTYFVAVQSFYIEDSDITLVNQHYWGDEEGPIFEYIRAFVLEGDEVIQELTTSYVTMESAVDAFASKSHVHFRTVTASLSVWDYCNGNQILFSTDSPILYTDTRTPRHAWVIETTATVVSPNQRFIRLIDLHDASKIYQRSGTYSNGVISWGDWYKFNGEIFTP